MATSPRPVVPEPVAARPVQLDQVEHLLKLQKWAQKITSILDLDELIDQDCGRCGRGILLRGNQPSICTTKSGASWRWPASTAAPFTARVSRLKVGKEGMVGYVAATRQMRYAPDVRQDPVLHRVRGIHALRGGHSAYSWMVSWWACFRLRITTWTLSPASICAGCRVCAITLQSLYTMRAAFSMNATSASA